ncbi:MAG: class II fructose-bisphosphate aldolase [Candidatus Veblenbacteria bacterium]|nr:class II fructose-bisphosphate aldolase [Candidatus Veblenbacteria bacterium]MDZ4229808.1 class II fructose-bisphosphate aldolase [Candidatus Veblenbacteria bacterium]
MLTSVRRIITQAYRQHRLVVAFNTMNAETTLAVARAARQVGAPTLFEISEKTIVYLGLETVVALVRAASHEAGGRVPLGLHLDHGRSFKLCASAIRAGFSSVMIDGSALPFKANVQLTKRVVDFARRHRVMVQGEVGALVPRRRLTHLRVASELMTDPVQAREFVRLTGVDSLGVAVGTLHGPIKMFRKLPKIDFKRLRVIHEFVRVPLVLHGGSGVPVPDLKRAAKLGVTVVNIDTELRLAYLAAMRRELARQRNEYDPRVVFGPVVAALTALAVQKLRRLAR